MALTTFEMTYLCVQPFLMPLHREVHRRLMRMARTRDVVNILDVGGRKSHYTVGVPGRITISDVPRQSAVQTDLNLGITEAMMSQLRLRRSNIYEVLFDDMTQSRLPTASFDCVVAVEVLEHVEEDWRFVSEVNRVLRPGGTFLMTTPNGDSVANSNPDHKRHYRRAQLQQLLERAFVGVRVEYAIAAGRFRTLGLRPWRARNPLYTAGGMFGNLVNSMQSARVGLRDQPFGTRHLLATAIKSVGK